jgi:hypothetical protein
VEGRELENFPANTLYSQISSAKYKFFNKKRASFNFDGLFLFEFDTRRLKAF